LEKLKKQQEKLGIRIEKVELRLNKIELRLDKVELRLKKIEKKLEELEIRLEKLEIEVGRNTKSIDNLAEQVVENTEVIKQMVTTEEFYEKTREILDGQDKAMTILKRLDEERIFANTRLID